MTNGHSDETTEAKEDAGMRLSELFLGFVCYNELLLFTFLSPIPNMYFVF